jgi:hypothetical protein
VSNETVEPPGAAEPEDVFDARRRLVDRFHAPDMAFGLGGQRAELIGSLESGTVLGGLVVIDDETGAPLVAQLQGSQLVEQQLGDVELVMDADTLGTTIRNATVSPVLRAMRGDLLVLGRLRGDTFEPGAPAHGFAESRYRPATEAETRLVLDHQAGTDASLTIGAVLGAQGVPARLRAKGFSRHTFLCGQSGSGKTYATGVMLERLRLETSLPMLVLDPNSDHVHLGQVRPDAADHPDADRYRAKAHEVLVARALGKGGDHVLAVHFSELAFREQTLLLGLDPVADLDLYASFREAVAGLGAVYSVQDVRDAAAALGHVPGGDLATRIDNLEVADWGMWCRPGEASFVDASPLTYSCVVIDLGSLERPSERILVAMALLEALWRRRAEKRSILLVVDEAHNVFPSHPTNPLEAAAAAVGVAIAAEGRKFGLHLLLATQRPSKVEANVVTQCDNLALLRVNSSADVDDLCRIFSHVPAGLIRRAPEQHQGEVLFAGPVAELPLRAKVGRRLSPEGGSDLPTDWASSGEG